MKNSSIAAFFLLLSCLPACTKCYECKTSIHTREFCKGSQEFVLIQNGAKMVDDNGETFSCKAK